MRRELKELVGAVKDLMGDTSREHVYSQLSSERAKVAQLQARVSFLEGRMKEGDVGWKLDLDRLHEAQALLRTVVLMEREWQKKYKESAVVCVCCLRWDGHAPDCRLARVLK
jgi:hypothetical protein